MNNSTISCPNCTRSITPRGVHAQGRLVSTYCPFCGETIEDFSPNWSKHIPTAMLVSFIVFFIAAWLNNR